MNRVIAPAVGMGATIIYYTDRVAGTIVKVTKCQVHVQTDKAIRIDKNGMSDAQEWRHERDPDGEIKVFHKSKRGYVNTRKGIRLGIGYRNTFHDFSF